MAQLHRLVRGLLAAGGLAALSACGDTRDTATIDSALARDLTLASSATSTVSIGDTAISGNPAPERPVQSQTQQSSAPATPTRTQTSPPRPAPPRPAPAPTPPPATTTPEPTTPVPTPPVAATGSAGEGASAADGAGTSTAGRSRGLGAGVALAGTTNAEICSLANKPGDRFVVSLSQAVNGPDGATLPAGTPVLVEMASVSETGQFAFRLRGVQLNGTFIPAEGTVAVGEATLTEKSVSQGGDAGKVATGAVVGAILGRVLGGGTRGTVIGAAGGAAAGTVAAARNRVTERCLPAGVTLTATLSAPLALPTPAL